MADHDWSRFLLRIPLQSDQATIFQKLATQEGLETWFLRKALFLRNGTPLERNNFVNKGDSYQWLWHGWPDEVCESGSVLEMNGTNIFMFSFGKAGNVRFRIYQENQYNILELVQDEIPATEEGREMYYLGCTKGWLFYLTNLKSILEGGIDLRNRDVGLVDVVNA
jgi:hypothetical protein